MLPITDRHVPYAQSVADRLRADGLRTELDGRPESVARKIRDAELRKVPYMLIVGDKEQDAGEVAIRRHGRGDEGSLSFDAFNERLQREVQIRSMA